MKMQDRKEKSIRIKKAKEICKIRADHAVREKPTEKTKEYFKRKAYTK